MSLKTRLRATGAFISRHWLSLLTDPFVRTPGLMLCLTAMQTVVPYYHYGYVIERMPANGAGLMAMAGEAVAAAWCVLTPYCVLRRVCRPASILWLSLSLLLFSLNWLIDYVLLTIYETSFNVDIATVLMATDPGEGANFVSAYLTPGLVWGITGFAAGFTALYLGGSWARRVCRRRWHTQARDFRLLSSGVLAVAWIITLTSPPYKCIEANLRQKIATFCKLDFGHGLVEAHPDLVIDRTDAPAKIVVVLGESHSRSHSSLYGYGKRTQPLQAALAADSALYVYAEPTAPALTTLCSVHRLIGTWNGKGSENWYECLSFLEVARMAGYRTLWLSNQSCKGVCDSPMVKIAEFCDEHYFTNDGMHGMVSARYDGELLPLIDSHFRPGERDFTLIHLMGSHVDYAKRYPSRFRRFTAADYGDRPLHQRQTLADYDNSVFYNDFILSEIYKRYEGSDAVVIYLSDHSQDLYESSPHFKGHAKADVPKSRAAGLAVPFTVWLSPRFRAAHPQMASRIEAATDRPVALTDLVYTLMDLMGARFADSDEVAARSFFRPL